MMTIANRGSIRSESPLTNDQLQKYAPSIFATTPWHAMSDRYAFIPTIEIVEKMRSEGFLPVAAQQSRCRIPGKSDFTKHMIRFRDFRAGAAPAIRELGTVYPELVLTNAHDGASSYKLDAGLFRLVCTNGMVVSSGNLSQINVRHSGNPGDVISISHEIIEEFPKVLSTVNEWGQKLLPAPARDAFASAALVLKYGDEEPAPITPEVLLQPRRGEDREPTLWNTFNVVQEKLIGGGDRYRRVNPETGRSRRGRTRAVSGIAENTRLNKALWMLAEKMKELAS